MRVTTKGARAFFLWTLCAFVVMMLVIGYQMANAFNLSPFTYQMRERGVSANYAYISGDTLYMNNMAVSVAAVLKAVALQADTLRGASSIVGVVDDTLIVDTDSTGSDVTIRFGRWGAGLRWHRATDALQFSNDFSTWTDIGSGGSGSAGAEIHDSLDANWATFTAGGGSADSNAITYETDRVAQYSDTGLYLGDIGDSTMLWYDLTADNIKAYVILYYVDDISDSALMSKYWIETTIGDSLSANGFLTGLNSTNGISGGASQNIVNIQLDPTFFAVGGDTVRIQNLNAGKLAFNVFGSPTDYDELVITENTLTTRTIGSWRVVYTNGSYALAGATVGAANTVFVGNGTSSAPSFRALTDADIPDNITITETGDISNVGVTAPITGGGSSGSVTVGFDWTWLYGFVDTTTATIPVATLANSVLFSWLYTFVDTTTAVIPRATLADSCTKYDTTFVDFTELRAEIKNRSEIYNKIDTTSAKIPTASLADSAVKYDTSFVDWTELRAEIKNRAEIWNKIDTTSATIPVATLSNSVLFSWLYTFVDTTTATLPHATFADSTGKITHSAIKPWHLDTTASYVIGNLRTRSANQGLIQSNNFKATDPDSSLKIGGGGGLTIGSNITLGTDITDDTSIVTLASEWAGMVLARGYRDDSTKYWDSVTIRGGSDSYGNYIEFGKLGSDTTGTTPRRRHLQVAIPVPMDADTIYDVALSYRVFDGTGGESTYVRLKWSTTPFDSTNIFKTAYTEIDSTNGTTFDTLSAAYARTSVSRGSKIYALVTGLLYDKHVTWIRCYDLIMTYHRRYL